MFKKNKAITLVIIMFFGSFHLYAQTVDVSLRIRDNRSDEKIINQANLKAIKHFIIKKGLRETWGSNPVCADNPAYHTDTFSFWLKPNIYEPNKIRDINESNFQTLVIRNNRKEPYCEVHFQEEFYIYVVALWPSGDLTVSQIRQFATDAIKEILSEIEKDTSGSDPTK